MTVRELREKYLRFYESKGHQVFPSGSLIPIDVTGKLDESLLFNGAGMIQFKPYFRGVAQPENKRLTTAQKCFRTGDIDEVGDDSHLTFFEMMGNFSFGDYFKKEAIAFSWEFLTSKEWLGLDTSRLAFSVFEEDDEAVNFWSGYLSESGIDPAGRVFRLSEESNYWPAGAFSNGPPGPCGPNSEMFYWTIPTEAPPESKTYTKEQFLEDEANGKWLEIWNDVFITYEWQGEIKNPQKPSDGYKKTGMPELPFRSIDTGMGLERTVVVLSGKESVYETDAFVPLIEAVAALSSVSYEDAKRGYRVICDHIRSACFCIGDGILPTNNGRGYVLRRLLRRAVLQGFRTLEIKELFIWKLVDTVVKTFGDHYTELKEKQATIEEILRNEEALFRKTLSEGVERISRLLEGPASILGGEEAFKLYDTFGFPLEVTLEMAEEKGWKVDLDGYESAMVQAQARSRAGTERESVYGGLEVNDLSLLPPTNFLGYSALECKAKVLFASTPSNGTVLVALNQTPFYAASGGQTSDGGVIHLNESDLVVSEVTKKGGVFLHKISTESEIPPGSEVTAKVDQAKRASIRRNHTATHLLHAALHKVIGNHATQAGSYVGPDRLRFDFTHGQAIAKEDLARIEQIVNSEILENLDVVTYVDIPISEAKERGAMALFGEKYGDKVRMVEIGEFSRELCGGTHVRTTGEIGFFKILAEQSASSGVRRIEALTGEGAIDWIQEQFLKVQQAASALKSTPKDLLSAIEKNIDAQAELKRQLQKARAVGATISTDSKHGASSMIGDFELYSEILSGSSPEEALQTADSLIQGDTKRIALIAATFDGKISIVAKVGKDAMAAGAHAGNLVREVAKITGGGGGGGPAFATAGGRDISKLDEAMAAAEAVLRSMVVSKVE